DGGRPGEDELQRVQAGGDAADPDDGRGRQRGVHLVDAADRDRPDGGSRQAAGHAGERGPQRLRVDRHPLDGVDEGEAVGARVDAGQRYGDDVRDVWGELGEDGDAGPHLVADRPHDGRGGGRVPGEHAAAVLDVGAGDVDLDAGDARHVAEPAAEVGVLLDAAAGDGDD